MWGGGVVGKLRPTSYAFPLWATITRMRKAIGIVAGAVALGLAGAWLWRRYGPGTYLRFNTKFGKARVYEVLDDDGAPVRLLEVGGIVQSGTYLDDDRYTDLVFEYLKRYDALFEGERSVQRVLVLGCGGYDYPEHLVAHYPDVIVDAVEIDPAITAIAQQYFFLDRVIEEFETEQSGRLNLICDDALAYLQATDQRYDAIVNDTFDAGTPPAHLTTPAFARAVREHLNPGGLYLTNIVSALEGPDSAFLREQAALLEHEFGNARIVPCAQDTLTEADNVIVICENTPA